MRILITGGAGFIGSNLLIQLDQAEHTVRILDNFSNGDSVPFAYSTGYCSSQTQNNTLIASAGNAAMFDTGGVKTKTLTTS